MPNADFLIVDGHSVIFAWPELRAAHQTRQMAAREALVGILRAYQDASGIRVVLVFDGRGGSHSDVSEPDGIQIFYSKAGATADSVIERLVAKYSEYASMLVATSDRMEQQTVHSFGAEFISAEDLRLRVEAERKDLEGRIAATKKKKPRR